MSLQVSKTANKMSMMQKQKNKNKDVQINNKQKKINYKNTSVSTNCCRLNISAFLKRCKSEKFVRNKVLRRIAMRCGRANEPIIHSSFSCLQLKVAAQSTYTHT